MKKIYKYSIPINDEFDMNLPKGIAILSFQCQRDVPFIWALVDPDALLEKRSFRLVGTGHPINMESNFLHFIGTVQMAGGQLVWHLFEIEK